MDGWSCRNCQITNDDAYTVCVSCGSLRSSSGGGTVLFTPTRQNLLDGVSPISGRRMPDKDASSSIPARSAVPAAAVWKYTNNASSAMQGLAEQLVGRLSLKNERQHSTSKAVDARSSDNSFAAPYDVASLNRSEQKMQSILTGDISAARNSLERSSVMSASVRHLDTSAQDVEQVLQKRSPSPTILLQSANWLSSSGASPQPSPARYVDAASAEVLQLRCQLAESRNEIMSIRVKEYNITRDFTKRCAQLEADATRWKLEVISVGDHLRRCEVDRVLAEKTLEDTQHELARVKADRVKDFHTLQEEEANLRMSIATDTRCDALKLVTAALRLLCDATGPIGEVRKLSTSIENVAVARSSAVVELKGQNSSLEMQLADALQRSEEVQQECNVLRGQLDEVTGHASLQAVLSAHREHCLQYEVHQLRQGILKK